MDKEKDPGKFIFVNRADQDGDGIPDYADAEVAGQKSLVPVVLEIRPLQLLWDQLAVRFVYPGAGELPDFGGNQGRSLNIKY